MYLGIKFKNKMNYSFNSKVLQCKRIWYLLSRSCFLWTWSCFVFSANVNNLAPKVCFWNVACWNENENSSLHIDLQESFEIK